MAVVADDDEFFRLALTTLLRGQHGFETVLEADGFEAACALIASRPDVAVAFLDLDMPGMDDLDGLRTLRRTFAGRVVVISASLSRGTVLLALDKGAHGYIGKTSGPGEVSRALGIVLGGDIYVPAALADLPEEGSRSAATVHPGHGLTPRQAEVLDLIAAGASNREIGRALGLRDGTVKAHVAGLLKTLGVARRAEAAALRRPLAEPPTG